MAQLAFIVVYLALAGALVSWIAGAWFYARTLRASADAREPSWLVVIVWPFALGRLKGAAAAPAANVNKALLDILASQTVDLAATSVATNLARVSR
jgi:hypothetical protein